MVVVVVGGRMKEAICMKGRGKQCRRNAEKLKKMKTTHNYSKYYCKCG